MVRIVRHKGLPQEESPGARLADQQNISEASTANTAPGPAEKGAEGEQNTVKPDVNRSPGLNASWRQIIITSQITKPTSPVIHPRRVLTHIAGATIIIIIINIEGHTRTISVTNSYGAQPCTMVSIITTQIHKVRKRTKAGSMSKLITCVVGVFSRTHTQAVQHTHTHTSRHHTHTHTNTHTHTQI
jgi:hypothetical protein